MSLALHPGYKCSTIRKSKSPNEDALGARMNMTPLITEDEIKEIKTRCGAATPGPWQSYVERREKMSGSDFIRTAGEDIYLRGATVADQDFIAHARQDIPKLIAEVERLRKLLSE
jgi:hypothetical protein